MIQLGPAISSLILAHPRIKAKEIDCFETFIFMNIEDRLEKPCHFVRKMKGREQFPRIFRQ